MSSLEEAAYEPGYVSFTAEGRLTHAGEYLAEIPPREHNLTQREDFSMTPQKKARWIPRAEKQPPRQPPRMKEGPKDLPHSLPDSATSTNGRRPNS
jgi:hypothetical protein